MKRLLLSLCTLLLCSYGQAWEAWGQQQFILHLKNGEEITTTSYRTSGDMVWYQKYGGEIGIKKHKILKIERPEDQIIHKGKNPVTTVQQFSMRIPTYYEVMGSSRIFNQEYLGVYEEDGRHNNNGVFRNIKTGWKLFYSKKLKGWALGTIEYSREKPRLYLPGPPGNPPRSEEVWVSTWGAGMSPTIRIKSSKPPATVFDGRVCYAVSFLPNDNCNGMYRPSEIKYGRVVYRHESSDATLFFQEDRKRSSPEGYGRWYISYRNHLQYQSHPSGMYITANEIQRWREIMSQPVKIAIVLKPCN